MIKRIALISEHASPLATLGGVDSGGQNVYVAEVSKQLAKQGFLVDVFTRKDDEALEEIHEWLPGLRVIHVDAGPPEMVEKEKLLGYMDDFASYMLDFIRRNNLEYDVIHANFFMSAYVADILYRWSHIPYVVTFHALGLVRLAHQKEMDHFPVERFTIERNAIMNAACIVAECPQDRDDMVKYYDADPQKIQIVPCGCNLKSFYPVNKNEAREKLGIDTREKVLLQLGRMVPRKGVDNVISAAGLLKDKIDNLRLVIVGGNSDDPDEQLTPEIGRLKSVAQKSGIADQVIFTGSKQRDELKYYYSAADLFITTPWYEPFGITPLESMACGTPVIGARVGGIQYTIKHGETGLLVPPKNPQALASAIKKAVSDPEMLHNMKNKSVKRVKKYFTWKIVASGLVNIYCLATEVHKKRADTIFSLNRDLQLDDQFSLVPKFL